MSKTLKEVYALRQLRERASKIDDSEVIAESRATTLILEAFNQKQMNAAIDIVKKLKSFNFGNLTALAKARDKAVNDVTKVLAGQKEQGVVRKIVALFKSEPENPLVDVLAFANALHNFFGQFEQYITALGPKDESQTLGSVITGLDDKELASNINNDNLGDDEKKQLANLQKLIINGLKPDGLLANVGKNWIDKYLGGRAGLKQLAQDMLKVSVKDLKTISASVEAALKDIDAVGQAAAGAAQQSASTSTPSTGSSATTGTSSPSSSKSTKEPDKSGPTSSEDYKQAESIFSHIENDVNVDKDDAIDVIRALIKSKKFMGSVG